MKYIKFFFFFTFLQSSFAQSSNFGTLDSCRYNLENLLSAGITNQVFSKDKNELSKEESAILDQLAELGYEKYLSFKNHPKFIPYLEQMSTLKYYAKTNIGRKENIDRLIQRTNE